MTDLTDFQRKIRDYLPEMDVRFQEPMARHTSFRIGGPAEVMAFPQNGEELAALLKVSKELDCKPAILGAGTNILAPDEGLPGLTICLKDAMDGMENLEDDSIYVAAGVTMARAAVFAANAGLSGLEFAHGIPGTVGGGVYMNAGAYGGEICQVCSRARVMDPDGTIRELSNQELGFSYRHSVLEESGQIVLGAWFHLTAAPTAQIREKMQELMAKRRASQPLDLPSAGSAFKRPQGAYAAALIQESGLKGFQIGGAAVSQKHAGFVVNLGGATARDVRMVLEQVAQKVREDSGFTLEPEVRIW